MSLRPTRRSYRWERELIRPPQLSGVIWRPTVTWLQQRSERTGVWAPTECLILSLTVIRWIRIKSRKPVSCPYNIPKIVLTKSLQDQQFPSILSFILVCYTDRHKNPNSQPLFRSITGWKLHLFRISGNHVFQEVPCEPVRDEQSFDQNLKMCVGFLGSSHHNLCRKLPPALPAYLQPYFPIHSLSIPFPNSLC